MKQVLGIFKTGIWAVMLMALALTTTSCTKGNYDAFFKELSQSVPLDEVRYKLPAPDSDTAIIWYAPYRIFENRTEFVRDSIFHQERFNWQGLGDFLWEKYQERKERKASRRQERLEQTYNSSEDMKIVKDFTVSIYDRLTEQVPELVKIDEYRGQLQGVELENMIVCPMALMQLQPIGWEMYKRRAQQGRCVMKLHIIQDNYLNSYAEGLELNQYLSRHDLPQKIYAALQGFEGEFYSPLRLVENTLDDDPSNWLVDTISFETYLTDTSINSLTGLLRVEPDIEPKRVGIDT